jgi:hypothetical protein
MNMLLIKIIGYIHRWLDHNNITVMQDSTFNNLSNLKYLYHLIVFVQMYSLIISIYVLSNSNTRSYSYRVKSSKVLAMIQEIKHLRKIETNHCLLRHEYFVTVNMIVIFNTRTAYLRGRLSARAD